jgi:hypothetical protein
LGPKIFGSRSVSAAERLQANKMRAKKRIVRMATFYGGG